MRIPRFAGAAGGIVVTIAVLLSGCTPAGDQSNDTIRVNGSEPANPLNPADTAELGGFRILQALFAGLVAYDESGNLINDVAESIEPNADNTVYTVTIRGGSAFTNGEPVTANSFVDAWDWAALASNKAVNQDFFSDIVGFSADEDASLIAEGGLVVLNDDSFEVHLRTPISDFPQRLGHTVFSPLPQAFFDDPAAFAQHPIGNGPYMLDGDDAWEHGERIELAVNDDYDGEREPHNSGITMTFYETLDLAYADLLGGHLDVLDTLPASSLATFRDELDANNLDQPTGVLESITIPTSLAHFAGPEGLLRRTAISMALDRAEITDDVFGVKRLPAQDFATPALATFQEETRGSEVLLYNKDAAEEAWAEADTISPWDGQLEIAYNVDGGHQEWVDAVAAQLSATLKIDVVGHPYQTFAQLQTAIADGSVGSAYRTVVRADYPGVVDFIGRYASSSPENAARYVNSKFDAKLTEGSKAKTQSDAQDAYSAAQTILLTDLPSIPLWNSTVQAGYGAGLEDVALDWHGVPLYDAISRSEAE
jgi:oligopeptide transport system substrate-binding protein